MADSTLDITRDVCPMTWVKTRLALEDLNSGDTLSVLVNQGESLYNVRTNAKNEGHIILDEAADDLGKTARLIINKN